MSDDERERPLGACQHTRSVRPRLETTEPHRQVDSLRSIFSHAHKPIAAGSVFGLGWKRSLEPESQASHFANCMYVYSSALCGPSIPRHRSNPRGVIKRTSLELELRDGRAVATLRHPVILSTASKTCGSTRQIDGPVERARGSKRSLVSDAVNPEAPRRVSKPTSPLGNGGSLHNGDDTI